MLSVVKIVGAAKHWYERSQNSAYPDVAKIRRHS